MVAFFSPPMTPIVRSQYARDFSEYPDGTLIHADWDYTLGTTSLTRTIENASSPLINSKQFKIARTSGSGTRSVKFTPIGTPGTVDILTLTTHISNGSGDVYWGGVYARGTAGVDALQGFLAIISGQKKAYISQTGTSSSVAFNWTDQGSYWMRMTCSGTTIALRVWAYGDTEPVAATVTKTTSLTTGDAGMITTRDSSTTTYAQKFISFGLNGTPAPSY